MFSISSSTEESDTSSLRENLSSSYESIQFPIIFDLFPEKFEASILAPDSFQSKGINNDFDFNKIINENNYINNSDQNSPLNILNNSINSITKSKKIKKLSGRKRKNDKNNGRFPGYHNKMSKDNVQRRVQVHFFNKFLLPFVNEILSTLGFQEQFININYKIKKIIKNEYL